MVEHPTVVGLDFAELKPERLGLFRGAVNKEVADVVARQPEITSQDADDPLLPRVTTVNFEVLL